MPVDLHYKTYDITIMYIDEEGQIYGQPVVWQKKLKQIEGQLTEYHSKIKLWVFIKKS